MIIPDPNNFLCAVYLVILARPFNLRSNTIDAQDNERSVHQVYLNTYWIDRYPVTCREYREFIAAGGYENRQWWSEASWRWLEVNPVSQPLYWFDSSDWDAHPVCGVSWYEAEAYANFVGKRLPTEAEWEKAASWNWEKAQKRSYPWGETLPSAQVCNYDTLIGHTTPVAVVTICSEMSGNGQPLGSLLTQIFKVIPIRAILKLILITNIEF